MQELNLPSASAALLITIHTSEFQICIIQIPLLKVYDIFSNSVVNLRGLLNQTILLDITCCQAKRGKTIRIAFMKEAFTNHLQK